MEKSSAVTEVAYLVERMASKVAGDLGDSMVAKLAGQSAASKGANSAAMTECNLAD